MVNTKKEGRLKEPLAPSGPHFERFWKINGAGRSWKQHKRTQRLEEEEEQPLEIEKHEDF